MKKIKQISILFSLIVSFNMSWSQNTYGPYGGTTYHYSESNFGYYPIPLIASTTFCESSQCNFYISAVASPGGVIVMESSQRSNSFPMGTSPVYSLAEGWALTSLYVNSSIYYSHVWFYFFNSNGVLEKVIWRQASYSGISPKSNDEDFKIAESALSEENLAKVQQLAQSTLNNKSIAENYVFPNPFINQLNLNFNTQLPIGTKVSLLDITGKLIHSSIIQNESEGSQFLLNTENISKGTYLLQVEVEGMIVKELSKVVVK